ncbi:TonB-dependent receptor plug domain-containing protein [Parvularcula maris]|uniref:TonB-dependent receptor n=1 Tax=Parvularcula maris TaxID=2965077 RepID=A0A9X2L916_9PROT|nr:TonB-dependent receptor [Parvularcula maris]MCQ8185314.1 TonB-dependent receptor [Parvularcula maris]
MSGNRDLLRLLAASTMLTAFATSAMAQDAPIEITPQAEEAEERGDEIVVTGSRLRRNEFNSISPVQVIDADTSRLSGLATASDFITQSPVVTGAQLDSSINAGSPTAAVEGVGAGGVGANNVSLRGLGPERTLLLVNGRRLAPSGVRGAPVAPDLNLIPGLAVETVELLTDGASSIYGSDAVAGVANIILKKDFEGFEVAGQWSQPFEDGGRVAQIGFLAGTGNDRGSVMFAGEYFHRETVLVGDRPDFNDCLRDIDLADNGEIFSVCADARPANAAVTLPQFFVYRTPGFTSDGLPEGFSTNADLVARGINRRTLDVYGLQDEERATQLLAGVERYNIFTSGDYEIMENLEFYFEASFAQRTVEEDLTNEQIFPGVPGLIPQEDENGNIIVDVDDVDEDGDRNEPLLVDNPLNPFAGDALPVVSSLSLPQERESTVSNLRLVGGFTGDIPPLADKNWVYDVGLTFDRSYGTATQPILREDALRQSLDTLRLDSDGNPICGTPRTALTFGFLTPEDCVVVDFFNDSLYTITGGIGDFATPEERDFLRGRAFNTTEIEQRQAYGLFTGDMFDMPAGTVGLALGIEYRELEIESLNDIVRQNGLAASEVPDIENDTIGRTWLFEVFGETEVPIHETVSVNLSGRYTEEKNFGNKFTYSVKGNFEPTDWLRLRATYGTTFRAPNLRDQFLAGQAGTIGGGNDPCLVPNDANDGGTYDPTGDQRPQALLDQCVADGADPTALGLGAVTGIPIQTGGSVDLEAETSDSLTAGVVFDAKPFTDAFDFDLSVTYFEIDIEDTVQETSAAGTLGACYSANPDPNACARVTRNPGSGTVSLVRAPFINIGSVKTSGIDYVARFGMDLDGFGETFNDTRLGLTFAATQTLEYDQDVDPSDDFVENFAGTIGFPEFSFLSNITVERGAFTGLWRSRYFGKGQQEASDDFADTTGDEFGATACDIAGYVGQCRDVDFVDNYVMHDASVSYAADSWTITAGVQNVFDAAPPLVDQGEAPARTNIVVQSGYDLIGRRAFINARKTF